MAEEGICTRCTRCCTGASLVVRGKIELQDPSAERWLKYHGLHIAKVPQGWKITVNTTCEMLTDEGLCRIYRHRPKVCRDFFCPAAKERARVVKGERKHEQRQVAVHALGT